MSADPTQIRSMIQNAREALRRGDQAEARRWAGQAARPGPNLEGAARLLAGVPSPPARPAGPPAAVEDPPGVGGGGWGVGGGARPGVPFSPRGRRPRPERRPERP